MKTLTVQYEDKKYELHYCDDLLGKTANELFDVYNDLALAWFDRGDGIESHLYIVGDKDNARFQEVIFVNGKLDSYSEVIYDSIDFEDDLVSLICWDVWEYEEVMACLK